MEGPNENISSFTKNLYLYIAIGIAIIAGAVVYFAQQGNTETSLETLSKTSDRFAKALAACKTATFDISGTSYLVAPEGQQPDADTTQPVLVYNNHAVRGNVNSDAFNDMICTYDLTDMTIGAKTYIGVLFGSEDGRFFPGPMLLIGPKVNVETLSITGGIGTITYTESGVSAKTSRRFYLEGDVLTFNDNGKSGL